MTTVDNDILASVPGEDDLFHIVERFKNGLMALSTGEHENRLDDEEYIRTRKILLGSPSLNGLIPDFIKECRNTSEFWEFIKGEISNYAGRRKFLASVFNPILDALEEGNIDTIYMYEKGELLGQGGFGQVFKYRQKRLDIDFAFKIFAPAFSEGGEGHLERFFREARILFQLNHPNIIKVHDVGMLGRRPYIRMEFFDGRNLNQVLQSYGKITPDKALVLIENIVDALRHAHEEIGVVHRDLKPSNIMVAKPNKFRIIDFGLGVFIENDLVSRITKTGEAVAGGYYTAPELLAEPKLVDPRSDIYSLGAIWFNVLTGKPPAGINIKELLFSSSNVTESYGNVLLKCLDNISERYKSCSELLDDIRKLKTSENWLE